jgi:hypothetical protein
VALASPTEIDGDFKNATAAAQRSAAGAHGQLQLRGLLLQALVACVLVVVLPAQLLAL